MSCCKFRSRPQSSSLSRMTEGEKSSEEPWNRRLSHWFSRVTKNRTWLAHSNEKFALRSSLRGWTNVESELSSTGLEQSECRSGHMALIKFEVANFQTCYFCSEQKGKQQEKRINTREKKKFQLKLVKWSERKTPTPAVTCAKLMKK